MAKYKAGNSGHRIEIEDGWRVLDVGSGHHPHQRANLLVDKELGISDHRSGKATKLIKEKPFVLADVQLLPFKDKVFDYVIASHVAEHVDKPYKFCQELMRVGKRGYIETPSKLTELLLGESFHQWFIQANGSTLIFNKKSRHTPVSELFYAIFYFGRYRAGHKSLNPSNRLTKWLVRMTSYILIQIWIRLPKKVCYTCFEWEESFAFKIEGRKHNA